MKFNLELFALDMRVNAAEKNMKLREVAAAIGSSKATICRMNNALGLPDVETFAKCCAWMGKPMDTYFSDTIKAF